MTPFPDMDLTADFFTFFHLPKRFRTDLAELDARYREVQRAVHPDRFAAAREQERRLSMQWAARANEAYRTLKTPLARAQYLLQLAGYDTGVETNTAMDPAFLMEQMEWREMVMTARANGDQQALAHLRARLRGDLENHYDTLSARFDAGPDFPAAAEAVRRLMFLEKLAGEIDDALDALEDGIDP
ncbi:MAG: Fe-S protein assembly co-chaperone HscB [Zoogloeaceae bacterium]|jgi:molecular chaperone HscB|nr:Fe-S protein assembly co-chaperone HscB [Zoogloeaceae bacterium]